MKERNKILWKNVAERTLAIVGYGTVAVIGPVVGSIAGLAKLKGKKQKAEEQGVTFTNKDSAKYVFKFAYTVPMNALSEIANVYEKGSKKLQAFDKAQQEIKEREAAEAAEAAEAKRKAIEQAESPKNLEKSPVGAIIKCIKQLNVLGTRIEANVTDVVYKFNHEDNQIITNEYIFQRGMVLDRAKVEKNFKADKRLNDGAVVFVIPAILHDLVGREIKKRIDQEEAIMKQKEIKTQKQAFIDALNKERQK